ncbi:MAG TPA: hypothetical protein VGN00_13055 [Puia sp.]|jgi:hypothetical protein
MPPENTDITSVISQQLGKYDLEILGHPKIEKADNIQLQALKLTPISTLNDKPLYIPVPVSLDVTLDDQGNITKIQGDSPDADAKTAAGDFYQGLVERKQIAGLSGGALQSNTTHAVKVNDKGQQVVRRTGFL